MPGAEVVIKCIGVDTFGRTSDTGGLMMLFVNSHTAHHFLISQNYEMWSYYLLFSLLLIHLGEDRKNNHCEQFI